MPVAVAGPGGVCGTTSPTWLVAHAQPHHQDFSLAGWSPTWASTHITQHTSQLQPPRPAAAIPVPASYAAPFTTAVPAPPAPALWRVAKVLPAPTFPIELRAMAAAEFVGDANINAIVQKIVVFKGRERFCTHCSQHPAHQTRPCSAWAR